MLGWRFSAVLGMETTAYNVMLDDAAANDDGARVLCLHRLHVQAPYVLHDI